MEVNLKIKKNNKSRHHLSCINRWPKNHVETTK